MSGADFFFDTNILLYLLSADTTKTDRAETLIGGGGTINIQVLNEFAAVASRKLGMTWAEICEVLAPIRTLCRVEALTAVTHERSLLLAERYNLSLYDAMIAAAALLAGCKTLYTENMHHSLVLENQLMLCNPFSDRQDC